MCIGAPLEVIEVDGLVALCRGAAGMEHIDLALIGPVHPGGHVLSHLGVAVRWLDAEEARAIADAVQAVTLATAGEPFEHLLADLIDRTPQLPAHLRNPAESEEQKENAASPGRTT
jgi:hydrogenase expression/formation protein HypC